MIPDPGVYPGVSRAVYESWEAVRQSHLKVVAQKTPAHARTAFLHPMEQTKAMVLGEACHSMVLEPAKFNDRHVHPPVDDQGKRVDRRSNANKAIWAAWEDKHQGKSILELKDWYACERVRDAVWEDPDAKVILGGRGANELGIVWNDVETGVLCKGLIDALRLLDVTYAFDLKSTVDASPAGWPRQVQKYGYHIQAAFYLDGLAALQPEIERRFGFICFEKVEPFAVAIYEATPSVIDQGRREYRAALKTWAKCEKTGLWPGYPRGIQQFTLPEWAYRDVEDEDDE